MYQEHCQWAVEETSFSVVRNRIDAIRKKQLVRTGYRVMDGCQMGVAGYVGAPTGDPWQQARENLADGVDYPFLPVANQQGHKTVKAQLDAGLLPDSLETVLLEAEKRHPDFLISNKINMAKRTVRLKNDQGSDLFFADEVLEVGLILKQRRSAHIMDAFLGYQARQWDPAFFLGELDQLLEAYQREIPLPDEPLLVVTVPDLLTGKLVNELNGERIGYGSSLFSNNLGQQTFDDKLTLYLDWEPEHQYHQAFFDAEGIVSRGRINLIENGVIKQAYTDRRTAKMFDMPLTGSAVSEYDGVPTLGFPQILIQDSGQSLKALLAGQKALVVVMASGGDYTDEGQFASPVQLGFLSDGRRLLGRVPDCAVSGHLNDLFGSGFVGLTRDPVLFGERALVVRMAVQAS